MKIKDIIDPILSLKEKYLLAARIRKCSDLIKSDIRRWKEDGEIPTRRIVLTDPNGSGARLSLSMEDLTETYNIDTLDAFILLDDLIKANAAEDKAEVMNLLGRLKSTACVHNGNITPEVLEQIKTTQPGVWAEYQKLLAEEDALLKEIEKEDPLNTEL